MLISPLMGANHGFGVGLGISDFDMIKRSFRNFATATIFSVITSSFYFMISPISEAQSELLARTQPYGIRCSYLFLRFSRNHCQLYPNPKKCYSGCCHCNCVDAASLYCRIRYSHREFVLFFWRFYLFFFINAFFISVANLSCGTRVEISQESFSLIRQRENGSPYV